MLNCALTLYCFYHLEQVAHPESFGRVNVDRLPVHGKSIRLREDNILRWMALSQVSFLSIQRGIQLYTLLRFNTLQNYGSS